MPVLYLLAAFHDARMRHCMGERLLDLGIALRPVSAPACSSVEIRALSEALMETKV